VLAPRPAAWEGRGWGVGVPGCGRGRGDPG
jgi:hypothetical protein